MKMGKINRLGNRLDAGGEGEGDTKSDFQIPSRNNCTHRNVL